MAENRITCTKCGTQLSGATIQQIIEWDKTHVCPAPDETLVEQMDRLHPEEMAKARSELGPPPARRGPRP